ncbi:sensor domain-containing diguanylate cyclase [Singulisphaera acidiphila]|uniref:diguanylate cyclase n=1 Tax=Singulisphaera acidiphila (strain ATCC BAA-1392 / DSM 18658 / VKM B-2454 / MOB10) TaxID=886293 RepID=L0D9F2_SINAD|nr:sensor domain-containing diguanylate cyclase [Singulisphaera acidiphila]AGA25286.1 diguanylate cyclase (GGDEF) domain-containing protein [Singulisphaera acidiphila DSM 18658]
MSRNGEKRLRASISHGNPYAGLQDETDFRDPAIGQGRSRKDRRVQQAVTTAGRARESGLELGDEVAYLSRILTVQTEIGRVGRDINKVMALVAERSQTLTTANGAVVELADGEDMVYHAGSGAATGHRGTRIAVASCLSGLCVRTGEVLHSEETRTDPRVNQEACRRIGIRSMIVAPLVYGGRTVGVLKVFSPSPWRFDDRDVCTLQLMAGFASAAMGHAAESKARLILLDERTKAMEALRRSEEQLTGQLGLTRQLNRELKQANRQLAEIARTDGLTGLKNRRHFDEALQEGYSFMSRRGEPVSVVMVDVDEFKRYNDSYGHQAGDEVLRAVATALQASARRHDTVARFGGEEFALLLLGADLTAAATLAERLRLAVEAGPWTDRPVTASFGVATVWPGCTSPLELVKQADQALYLSKRRGRNRVTCHDPSTLETDAQATTRPAPGRTSR